MSRQGNFLMPPFSRPKVKTYVCVDTKQKFGVTQHLLLVKISYSSRVRDAFSPGNSFWCIGGPASADGVNSLIAS